MYLYGIRLRVTDLVEIFDASKYYILVQVMSLFTEVLEHFIAWIRLLWLES